MEILNMERRLIKDRILSLIKALCNGVYERETTIRLCLLAALAGESVFLLGPPGIAKSFIAKRLIKAFDKSSFFDYLMTRFSTPEEVFGPLSIQELKDNGNYIRLTEGYLPTADVVFLDEIWKAGPAILNTLLTVVNERTFKNGQQILPIPMRLLITASNELPEANSGLDALYDRMLIRISIHRIEEKRNFKAMLMGEGEMADISPELTIKNDEFQLWQNQINDVKLSDALFEKIYQLKSQIEQEKENNEAGGNSNNDLYISDRRWKKSIRLLKACAYFNGRDEINPLDLLILKNCLWNNPQSLQTISSIIQIFATTQAFDQQNADNHINQSEQTLENATKQMLERLSATISIEKTRRKEFFKFDINNAKRFTINDNPRMIKLVLLQVNPSVSEISPGDSEWVYIDGDDLAKKIRSGKCEIYGYINRKLKLFPLRFEIDAYQQLIIKDISNRNINISLVKENNELLSDQVNWQQQVESAQQSLNQATQSISQSRIQFHSALPHNFLDEKLPVSIDNGFQQSINKVETLQGKMKKNSQRILNIAKYFE
ncbi:MAG: MoxR-like ATPase [Psychromonas sp.]|jgi:MoxR-like ATPase|uniref:ATPase RavA domain-containing protein n=1 Tax=Psychromonas sp. TaxID=1884585 RepID=UPI0039E53900